MFNMAFNRLPQRFGERLRLKATREVVLSAGTVSTPQILLLSGIGDTDHLKEVGALMPAKFLTDLIRWELNQ